MSENKPIEGTALGPLGSDTQPVVKPSWTCPTDKDPCEMFSCDGGNTCFLRKQTSGATYGTTYYGAAPPCHAGMYQLGWIGNAELMIGKESAAKGWDLKADGKIGLVIGLLGEPYPQGDLVCMNDDARKLGMGPLMVSGLTVPNIWIRWPDYGIVPFDRAWWESLLAMISQIDGAVLLYCMGGHGRSGSAAAILCALAGLVPEGDDPVAWVRQKYCQKVVESDEQCRYIQLITGRTVMVGPAKGFTTSYANWKGQGATTIVPKKKSHGGGSGKGKGPQPPFHGLSKRKWKVWWRHNCVHPDYHAIKDITRPVDLPDGQVFVIKGRHWRWSAQDDKFDDVTPTGADTVQPKE